jgi:uncharacterized protein YecE (DUF72 family)
MILVGTNGFQHRDWAPVFYPSALDPRFWLEYYCRHFGCCELSFTYYRLPEPATIQDLIEGSRGVLQFVFRVPFRLLEALPDNAELARKFAASLWPLKESGQLTAVLAQYGPDFGFIRDNFSRLCLLRDLLGIPLIADFACPEWLTPRAAKHLDAARIALACGDGVPLRDGAGFFSATAGLAYVRFQGRNHSRWLKGDGSARHDYLYSRAELAAAVPEIRRLEKENEKVLVIMNNPSRGQAPTNARTLLELLAQMTSDE